MSSAPKGVTWWHDPRLAHERRVVAITAILLLILALFLTGVVVSRLGDDEKDLPPPASPPPAATTPIPPPSPLQAPVQLILQGDLDGASRELAVLEAELSRLHGIIALRCGDPESAADRFQRAIALQPGTASDYLNLGTVHLTTGNFDAAIATFDLARKLQPDNDYIAARYFLAILQSGDAERCRREVGAVLEASPLNGLAQAAVPAAALALHDGQTGRAREYLEAARQSLTPEEFAALLEEQPITQHTDAPVLREFQKR